MGIQIDIPSKTISIPKGKMTEIVEACEIASAKSFLSKRDLQSLLRMLRYISKVVKPARGFLNRMLQCLRNMGGTSVQVAGDLQRDLAWFRNFVNWAGSHDHEVYKDASLMGLGVVWNSAFYLCSLPVFVKSQLRMYCCV